MSWELISALIGIAWCLHGIESSLKERWGQSQSTLIEIRDELSEIQSQLTYLSRSSNDRF